MLNESIIEDSYSPYTSPLVAIPKKDGKVRLCLDAREINKFIINDRTSPGEIEEILKKFHGARYISIWDTVCGYWQVELHPESRKYMAFIFDGRSYQFKRLPFGLINSVAVFVKCMDQVLGREALQFTTVYVDDLLITSTNWDEHCQRVEYVLRQLANNNITLKLNKSQLIANKVKFLGFMISEAGISPSQEKIQSIQEFPTPKNRKHLQSFLGLCNYYRKFRQNYSELTAQFKPQLTSKEKWRWSSEQDTILQTIKDKFLESIVLHHPDFSKPYFMNCDASDMSLGAELYQEDEGHNHLVIGFASRVLNKCERNYNVTEKELLSVVFACHKFRTYILGYDVTVRSDHKSISFLKQCKLSHGRLTRWILVLQEYNITWEYVPGRENIVADTLSRINIQEQTFDMEKKEIVKIYQIIKHKKELEHIIQHLKQQQLTDDKITQIRQRLNEHDEQIAKYYCENENVMFARANAKTNEWRIMVPQSVEKRLIQDYHIRYGHMGPQKIMKALEEHFYIKGLNKKTRNTIRTCHVCQLVKCNNQRKEGQMIPIMSERKLEKVFLDICGPFPRSGGKHQYKYLIIMVDHFSKYTQLYPVRRATTKTVLDNIIKKFIPNTGTPEAIITDHGTQFKGKRWKETLLQLGIKTYKISVYHPSSNPAERVLREVGRILRTYCHDQHKKWSEYLSSTETFLNLAHHNAIDETPYVVMHEKPPPREITDLIKFPKSSEYQFDKIKFYNKILDKTNRRRLHYQKQQKRVITYKIGEEVLIKNHQLPSTMDGIARKLLILYTGPYIVNKDNGNNTYILLDPNKKLVKGTYNQAEIKKYYRGEND